MFDKLLSWLREKARLWFGEDTPINVSVSAPMESAITLWAQMYDTAAHGVTAAKTRCTVWACPRALPPSWLG